MKMPKEVNRFCPKCNKVTKQKVVQVKSSKKRGALKLGSRRHERRSGVSGYGGYPRPKPENCKRWGIKLTKKVDLRYKCSECGKMTVRKQGFRSKKLELEAEQK